MNERDTDKLNGIPPGQPPTSPEPDVNIHYPEPTSLAQILKDVSQWAQLSFIMEPNANCKIQIFAPRKLPPDEAYEVFLASLSVVGLRAVRRDSIVKIVAAQVAVTA